MATSSFLIPLRFRIDENYLRDKAVSLSRFAYDQTCKDFLASMSSISPVNHQRNPPYQRLNTVLTALAPTLAHPFVSHGKAERQLLVVGKDVASRPTAEQISDVLYVWGKHWGTSSFEQEIKEISGKDAYQRLLDYLLQPLQQWQDVDAAFLFRTLDTTQTGFNAIPSLLASSLAGKSSSINGRTFTWHLAQNGVHGLVVMSPPFWAEYEDEDTITHQKILKKGSFAYKLEFRLQTQVGSSMPWLHLYVRCSRYVDEELTQKNWQRDVSVKMGMKESLLSRWNYSPTLVTLPIAGSESNPRWDKYLVDLLEAMKARSLITPNDLFHEPIKYREPTSQSQYDQYFVLHAEGFKPNHQVKTGFDFAEIHEVANSVSELLGLELSTGQKLPVDQSASSLHLDKIPLSMYTMNEFRRKTLIRKHPRQTKEVADERDWQEHHTIVTQALQRASYPRSIAIYLCWSNSFTKDQLSEAVARALFIRNGAQWPEHIKLVIPSRPIPASLLFPLDSGLLNPRDHYKPRSTSKAYQEFLEFQKKWEAQMHQSLAEKTQAWKSYLQSLQEDTSSSRLILIELPKIKKPYYQDQSIKGAVRNACNQLGLASQMIFPLQRRGEKIAPESLGRMRNAVADLLYRQTGLIYEQPQRLYMQAGLSQPLSEQLHVVGLYKLRKYSSEIHYPIAIRLSPDGTYHALLPQLPQRWSLCLRPAR